MKKILLKLYSRINQSVQISDEYIDSFSEPADDYDRVYYNYLVTTQGQNIFSKMILNILGILVSLFFIPIYGCNRLRLREQHKEAIYLNHKNRVGDSYSYKGRMPGELYEEYGDVYILNTGSFPKFTEGVISKSAWLCWVNLAKKHPFEGFLLFRVLVNIMGYNRLLMKYTPKALIVSRLETNGISSLITHLYEINGTEFINIMHGELGTSISNAFIRFSRFYVWDKHYVDVLEWARAAATQFIVFQPEIFKYNMVDSISSEYYLTYFFTGNEQNRIDENAEQVRDILFKFQKAGKKCKVRPHPRWSDYDYICRVFQNTNIYVEKPAEITVYDSIIKSAYVMGTFSTALTEAYYARKPIIIDDVTIPGLYEKMVQKMSFIISRKHIKLSDFLNVR